MRILIIDTSPIRRGAQIFAADLSGKWRQMGHVTIKTYLYRISEGARKVPLHEEDVMLDFEVDSWLEKFPTIQPSLLIRLRKVVKGFSPDLILLNGSRTLKYGAALRKFLPRAIPMVNRVIDNPEYWNPNRFIRWYYQKWVIPALDGAVGVSQASLEAMKRHYGFGRHTTVAYRSFEESKFEKAPSKAQAKKSLGLGEEDEVVLFLGNLTSQKRPDRFVDVIQKVRESRPRLKALMVGDGPEYAHLAARIASHSFISHHGYQNDVAPFLAASDLLLLTSDTEGLPGVVLEAAWFGVPVVASEVGGIRECVEDGLSGYLVQREAVHCFAERVMELLDHKEKRISMGQNAKRLVKEKFNLELSATQFLDFFEQIIEHKKSLDKP